MPTKKKKTSILFPVSLHVLWLPPTTQRHAHWLNWWLSLGSVNVSTWGCLSPHVTDCMATQCQLGSAPALHTTLRFIYAGHKMGWLVDVAAGLVKWSSTCRNRKRSWNHCGYWWLSSISVSVNHTSEPPGAWSCFTLEECSHSWCYQLHMCCSAVTCQSVEKAYGAATLHTCTVGKSVCMIYLFTGLQDRDCISK